MSIEIYAPERQRISRAEAQLIKMFRASFNHSQGNQGLQRDLFLFLEIHEYLDALSIPQYLPLHIDHAVSLPRYHIPKKPIEVSLEKERVWNMLFDVKYLHESNPETFNTMSQNLIQKLTTNIVTADLGKQHPHTPRYRKLSESPNRDIYDYRFDPHASYLREYGVMKRPAGYEGFDHLYSEVMSHLDRNDEQFIELTFAWEKNHPNLNFFPEQSSLST